MGDSPKTASCIVGPAPTSMVSMHHLGTYQETQPPAKHRELNLHKITVRGFPRSCRLLWSICTICLLCTVISSWRMCCSIYQCEALLKVPVHSNPWCWWDTMATNS